jgi:excisionase family DNA binding protein
VIKIASTTETGGGLMRVTEFCEALGIRESTGRKWILQRRISSIKVGLRAVRIPRSELQRLVREGLRLRVR